MLGEIAPPEVRADPLPLGAKPRSLTLARVGDTMKHGQPWAMILWGRNCPIDNEVGWDAAQDGFKMDPVVERLFRDELAGLGFKVAGDPSNLFKDDEDNGADLQVGLLITDVSLFACGGFTSRDRKLELADVPAVGSVQMSVEWQIYSPVESKVLAKIPTTVRLEFKDPRTQIVDAMLQAVVAGNVRALAASESFRTVVLSAGPSPLAMRGPTAAPSIALPMAQVGPARPLSEASGSVVALFAGDGMGSGFLVSRDGHLLTNRHVVGGARFLKVKWADGVETVGEVVRSDVGRDIALVKTDARGRRPLDLRRDGVEAGETVFAIGTPLDRRLQGSLSQGVVSANRILEGYNFIQSDVLVNPGNSGGPLLDQKGAVVGVAVSGIEQKGVMRGVNFFIPIDDALAFLSLKPSS
ncbi:trypsin-like peptidase domain-containing protein [Phenylobacterium sp.]|uniref:S1C family serine protease n=1 Tax=Phenylobacterium sp. TaxID=1871053 RepID=UPI00286A4A2A|nr:trypsin-like peptidase domain-containing protein [Phenylobacterium sp.]